MTGGGWIDPLHIVVLTEKLHAITGHEDLHPDGSLLQGLCTVIPQEYLHLTCTSIDVAPPVESGRQQQQFVRLLLAELLAVPTDALVAYRGDATLGTYL